MSNSRHGMSKTRLYHLWNMMNQRCNNPNSENYKNYGACGIQVCLEWQDPFKFMGWALLNGYQEDLSIERLDPSLGYEPNNCTWIPMEDQAINKKKSSKNTSGYVGVSYHKGKEAWVARVTVNRKRIEIGKFDTALEAHKARKQYFIDNGLSEHLRVYELQHAND